MIRFASVALAAVMAAACSFGADAETRDREAGPQVSRNYQVGAFQKIEVAGPYDVNVVTGGAPGVSATGGENLLAQTDVIVDGDTLKIMPKKQKGIRWNWTSNGKAVFTVNAAALRGASIAGSGGINVDKVAGDFEGNVAGSGDLTLAAVTGGNLDFDIAGSGEIRAVGNAERVDISIAGSGDVNTRELAARQAKVSIAGSGNVVANATETADVSIMGSGDVEVTGGAKCSVSKHGSGDVRCS
jgi:hypothetical protein